MQVVVANTSGITRRVTPGTQLGQAVDVVVIDDLQTTGPVSSDNHSLESSNVELCDVKRVDASGTEKHKLLEMEGRFDLLNDVQLEYLRNFLSAHHQSFKMIWKSTERWTWCRWKWILGMHLPGSSQCALCLCCTAGGCKAIEEHPAVRGLPQL